MFDLLHSLSALHHSLALAWCCMSANRACRYLKNQALAHVEAWDSRSSRSDALVQFLAPLQSKPNAISHSII
jgi:hypothetical protein